MNNRADAELVVLARTGNKSAFGILIERYLLMAKRAAFQMVYQEDVAQELAQEACLRAYLALGNLRDDANFRNWLYGIVLNVCRAYLRDQRIVHFPLEELADSLPSESQSEPEPEQIVEENEVHRRILEAIRGLSPENKSAVLLFYYEQLSLREIAENLGITVIAVKGRLHRARQQLRMDLSALNTNQQEIQGGSIMTKVSIGDVVWMKYDDGIRAAILLFDEPGRRALPIWIDTIEAELIARGLHNIATLRPLTFNFMASLLEASNAQLEDVRIQMLKGNIYYAVAKVRNSMSVREIDARPSDALSLAVLTQTPIYVSPEIPEQVWITSDTDDQPTAQADTMNQIRGLFEKQTAPNQFLSASQIVQEENPIEYLTRMGFLGNNI